MVANIETGVTQVCWSQSPCPCSRPLLIHAYTGDTHALKGRSGSVSVGPPGPGAHKVLFEPSKLLRWVWGLILNAILPLLPSCWGFSFTLEHGVSFFGGTQHSPINGCSAVSRNFGVLTEDETSFYSTILSSSMYVVCIYVIIFTYLYLVHYLKYFLLLRVLQILYGLRNNVFQTQVCKTMLLIYEKWKREIGTIWSF